jgi:hypothetical protein
VTPDSSGPTSTTEAPGYQAGGMPSAAARPVTPHPGPGAARGGGYGNIYTPHAGSMIIQVQRESGLQSRTIVLSARQIRILRFIMSRTGKLIAGGIAAIVVLLVVEAARIPVLTGRIARMEHTTQRLDTLEHSLSELQKRYDQVRTMMGSDAPADGEHAASAAAGFAPAPAIQTSAPGGAYTRTAAHTASRAATATATATDAPADAGTASNDAAGTDASTDSGAAATPAAAMRHRRAHSGAAAATPQSVVVPPPPDSGTPPSPQAEPQ